MSAAAGKQAPAPGGGTLDAEMAVQQLGLLAHRGGGGFLDYVAVIEDVDAVGEAHRGRDVLLDEPFEGLAPIIVRDLLATCRALADAGQTIVVVEQNISAAMTLADRVYVINNGHIVESMTSQAVRNQPEVLHRHLGV